jgi:hypothetical protein
MVRSLTGHTSNGALMKTSAPVDYNGNSGLHGMYSVQ